MILCCLHFESILNYYLLQEVSEVIEIEEKSIQQAIKNVAGKALDGRLRKTRNTGLKIWSNKLKAVIKEKRRHT